MSLPSLVKELKNSELFELYKLSVSIDFLLNDPEKLELIKRKLKLGDHVNYFDKTRNHLVEAEILEINRKTIKVCNKCNSEIWTIPFYMINVDKSDLDMASHKHFAVLDRASLKVGEEVGFIDRKNIERYGIVQKLNPKTAIVMVESRYKWKVAYPFLFKVMTGDALDQDMHISNYNNLKTVSEIIK